MSAADEEFNFLIAETEAIAGVATAEAVAGSAVCASFRREERIQRQFMIGYQALVFVLATATLGLLLVAIWSGTQSEPIAGLLEAGGAIVTGLAAKFLNDQRADARKAFKAAQRGLDKHDCNEAR